MLIRIHTGMSSSVAPPDAASTRLPIEQPAIERAAARDRLIDLQAWWQRALQESARPNRE